MKKVANNYNHLILFQEAGESDDFTDDETTWSTVYETYANIRPIQGREQMEAHQVYGVVTHKIETHWRSGITPAMRIETATGRRFQIVSVINVKEQNVMMQINCLERV